MEVSYIVQSKCPFSPWTLKLRHWVTWGQEGAQRHPAHLDGAEPLSAKGLSLSAKWLSIQHLHNPHGSHKITALHALMSGKSQFVYSYCLVTALLGDSLAEFEKETLDDVISRKYLGRINVQKKKTTDVFRGLGTLNWTYFLYLWSKQQQQLIIYPRSSCQNINAFLLINFSWSKYLFSDLSR